VMPWRCLLSRDDRMPRLAPAVPSLHHPAAIESDGAAPGRRAGGIPVKTISAGTGTASLAAVSLATASLATALLTGALLVCAPFAAGADVVVSDCTGQP